MQPIFCELETLFITTNEITQFYEIILFLTNPEIDKQNKNLYIDYV